MTWPGYLAASASPFSWFRSKMATLPPAETNRSTAPSPSPEAPPVTMATLPLMSMSVSSVAFELGRALFHEGTAALGGVVGAHVLARSQLLVGEGDVERNVEGMAQE